MERLIIQFYNNGFTTSEISKMLCISEAYVVNVLEDHGLIK